MIAQIAELPAELTSNLRHVDIRERRIAVRISRNGESRSGRGRAPPVADCPRVSGTASEARNCRRLNTRASRL